MYRFHIDLPLGTDKDRVMDLAEGLAEWLSDPSGKPVAAFSKWGINEMNLRLGNDDDRQKSNYLDINENGHASNKKKRITF